MIRNPVLPGFNPDPSIIRVGRDYYIATSTFVWQPAIRLFHSTDLASWTLTGHALHDGVHELRGLDSNAGIWAPNLTFDPADGSFYLAYSLVRSTTAEYFDVDNFVVTATDIAGPWSAPAYLSSVGFDPSFLHDDDGRHWVVTLEWDPRDGYEHPGAIVLEEFDAEQRRLIGPAQRIYRGGSDRGCLEGPNLYKKDGYYYLMAAEGGTGFGHGVTLARSRQITGPYQPGPVNPFITSNPVPHFGRNDHDYLRPNLYNPHANLQKAGHGSLVETPTGQWYVAHLCARPLEPERRSVLGRETALQQVEWTDDGWLRLTTGGTVAQPVTPGSGDSRSLRRDRTSYESIRDDFDGPAVDRRLSTLRRPFSEDWVTLQSRPGALSLRGGDFPTSRFDVSLVATQLQDFTAAVTTHLTIEPRHFSQSAGLVVFYDNENFAYLRVYRSESLASTALGIVLVRGGSKRELLLDRVAIDSNEAILHARIDGGNLQFSWRPSGSDFQPVGPLIDATYRSDEATRGFTGTMIGMVCVDSYRKDLFAHFDYFDLRHGAQNVDNAGIR